MKNKWIPIAIIASIGLFLAAIAIGVAYYQTKKPQKTVSIVGLAEKDFTSDLIVWEFELSLSEIAYCLPFKQPVVRPHLVPDYIFIIA